MKKKVSVCMATFNGARFIGKQLQSILSQLGPDDEVVISDDGSDDGTINEIESFGDPRVKLLRHKRPDIKKRYCVAHRYVCANFANALSNAKGDLIFLADQDDVWLPGRVEKMSHALEDCDYVMCASQCIDADGNPVDFKTRGKENIECGLIRKLIFGHYPGCHVAFSRRLFLMAMPIPASVFVHDIWIGRLAAINRLRMRFIDEPLMNYRIHESNVSDMAHHVSKNPVWFRIWYRLVLLQKLMARKYKISGR